MIKTAAAPLATSVSNLAFGLCPINQPLPSSVAQGEQFFAQLCNLGWTGGASALPCPVPNPPSIESTQSQSVVLDATVPAFMSSARKARWRAEAVNTNGSVSVLWTYTDEFPSDLPAGSPVHFRAPGLRENLGHRFSVAFEEASGAMTCWSSATTAATLPFEGGLAPPEDTELKLEDEFRGPATTHTGAAADGLGPPEAWALQQQVRIDTDEESALLDDSSSSNADTIGAGALHSTIAGNAHSFADVYYQNKFTTGQVMREYRVDAVARATGRTISANLKWYFAQVVNEDSSEYLRVGIRTATTGAVGFGSQPNKPCVDTPLKSQVGSSGRSEPVWIRLEVRGLQGAQPRLIGSVVNSDRTTVLCTSDEVDTQNPSSLWLDDPGYLGFFGHHRDYYADRFLGGWEQTP